MNKFIPKTIYQDKSILVIEKPAGLVVHPGNGVKEKHTLVDWLKQNKLISGDFIDKNRPGIVHRLDKDTSGLMVIARNQKVGNILQKKFRNREVEKKYIALVWGKTDKNSDTIISSIGRKPSDSKKRTTGRGKLAITKYKVLKRFKKDKFELSYLAINIKTGRTHQIRVHLKSIGHPIVGDKIYTQNTLDKISEKWGINRLFLHSSYLSFNHPITSKKLEFRSKLPKSLNQFMSV